MFSGLETLSMGKRACIYDDEFRAKILFSCVSPGDGDRNKTAIALLQNTCPLCYSVDLTRYTGQKGANEMATIAVDDSENLEKAIKRFKRMVEKEGIIREYKKREFYEKPSTILNRKNKALQRKLMKKTHPRHESKSAY